MLWSQKYPCGQGTHILSNHLLMPSLSKDDLLYQTENEVTPESLHSTAQQQTALEEKEKKAWKQEAAEAWEGWEGWDKDSRGLGTKHWGPDGAC